MFLDKIVAHKREELTRQQQLVPRRFLEARIKERSQIRPFAQSLAGTEVAVISEIKRASPSRGILRKDFDPQAIAGDYAAGGATAISVLTDEEFFGGCLPDLAQVNEAVHLPLLRKDFIIDPYQVYEACAWRADAVLLIVAILEDALLADCLALAEELGMAAVVEVHSGEELDRALQVDAPIIGINNRNLHTFEISLQVTDELAPRVPAGHIVISESGIFGRDDVCRVAGSGADAVLVGEALMRPGKVGSLLPELVGVPVQPRNNGATPAVGAGGW